MATEESFEIHTFGQSKGWTLVKGWTVGLQ